MRCPRPGRPGRHPRPDQGAGGASRPGWHLGHPPAARLARWPAPGRSSCPSPTQPHPGGRPSAVLDRARGSTTTSLRPRLTRCRARARRRRFWPAFGDPLAAPRLVGALDVATAIASAGSPGLPGKGGPAPRWPPREGSRPVRCRRRRPGCPARRRVRPARATAAAIPTGAGSSTPAAGWCRRPAAGWRSARPAAGRRPAGEHAQVDALAGLDHPGLAGLGLADGLGVDAGPVAHAGLGEPAGAVVVQLPVVLQGPDHPGQGQQPLGVRALVDHDPAGTGGERPGGLAVVPRPSTLWAATTTWTPTSRTRSARLMALSTPEARAREFVQDEQGVLALPGFAAGGVVAVVLQHDPHGCVRFALHSKVGTVRTARSTSSYAPGPRSKAPPRAAKKSALQACELHLLGAGGGVSTEPAVHKTTSDRPAGAGACCRCRSGRMRCRLVSSSATTARRAHGSHRRIERLPLERGSGPGVGWGEGRWAIVDGGGVRARVQLGAEAAAGTDEPLAGRRRADVQDGCGLVGAQAVPGDQGEQLPVVRGQPAERVADGDISSAAGAASRWRCARWSRSRSASAWRRACPRRWLASVPLAIPNSQAAASPSSAGRSATRRQAMARTSASTSEASPGGSIRRAR